MGRLKRVRDEWFDNFRWVAFWFRVVLVFTLSTSGMLFALLFFDRQFHWLKVVLSVLFGVYNAAFVADSFITNPKKLNWDYSRLRPTLPTLPQKGSDNEPTG